ncbi:MAG: S8 family serine peptidase [Thermoanaerobaculia bacterium]
MRETSVVKASLLVILFMLASLADAQSRAVFPPQPHCTPPQGLIGWWPFDETSTGNAADLLTLSTGRHVNGPQPVAGRVGGALQFDGRDDYVDIPSFRLNVDRDDFTIALWVRTRDAAGLKVIVDKRAIGAAVQGYSLYINNGRPGVQLADDNGPAICTSDPRTSSCTNYGSDAFVADDAWHSLVVTVVRRAPRGGTFYVDGHAIGTFDATNRGGSLRNDNALRVGARSGSPSGFFAGQVDELQLFRRALSTAEVAAAFRAPQCREVTPAIAISPEDIRPQYRSGTIVVKLEARVAAAVRGGQPLPKAISDLNRRFRAGPFMPLFRSLRRGAPGGLDRYFKLAIDPRVDALAAAREYAKAPGVESAEPNLIFHPATADPYYNPTDLWNLFKVNAAGAWPSATGSGVVVAVIDTGVDTAHIDLAGNIWTNNDPPGDQNGDGCAGVCGVDDDGDGTVDEGSAADDDENGYDDDVNGWDFVDSDNTPADLSGHGTHVAGTIAAVANNNQGVVGLAHGARIMPLRGLGANGGLLTDLANAVVYAANEGAGVINDSWIGFGRSPLMESVIGYARSLNTVVVNAAGNDINNACFYTPANVESALTVASTGSADVHSGFSNAGVKIDVSAPGEGILSTWPGNGYQTSTGTSMATPHVSALAALLKQKNPGWTPEQIRQAIRMTATDVGVPGFDSMIGWGRIDAAAAVQLTSAPPVASLEEPYNGARVHGTINLVGSAGGPGFTSYDLWVGSGIGPTSWTHLSNSTAPVSNGVLGTFNTTTLADGVYTFKLVSASSSSTLPGEDRNAVIIDNAARAGWPVALARGASKSPRVADLDGDGTNEIIIGATVLSIQGTIRAGWNPDPGEGRTNPVVLDVDGDGMKEVVAAVFDCYTACNSTAPNAGAIVVSAYRPNKTVLWSYTVVNPQSIPGFYHGTPSALSAGDVDGDGQDEIVFTVDFNYANSPYDTRVFVLNAKTGVQESAFQIPGRSMSSVALVPAGNGRLLVISSDSGVYVTDHNGNIQPGWPQTPGDGSIDPIAADADLDSVPDIVVGKWMWNLNGTLKTGWPPPMYSRGTSAVAQLSKQDCELEVVSGGANGVPTYVTEHDANLIYWTFNQAENVFVMGLFDNVTPGNVGIADVDGDGEPEVLHQPELGFLNGDAARVYGYQATSSSAALHFPMYFWEPGFVLHSTAAYADLDQDGVTDMLMMDGTSTLHAWSLGTPFNSGNAAAMFQHDLGSTGYYPPSQPSGADLWIEDTPVFYGGSYPDTGDEPAASMATEAMWASRAIWVRNTVGNPGPHQNPEAGQVNEVYVEVRNRGCAISAPGAVQVYYADASVGLSWPSDWHLIATGSIPAVAPGQSVQVTVQWTPLVTGHFCLLARITSEPMTVAEITDIDLNVRRNNNLAWRNVNVVDLLSMVQDEIQVIVANVRENRASIDLTWRGHEPFLAEGGALIVDLGRLFAPWKKAGAKGSNIMLSGTRVVIRALPATIEGIPMTARQKERITFTAQATEPLKREGMSNRYMVDLVESIERKEIGGVSYGIMARGLDADTDRDGIPDVRDPDDDNDGIPDARDPNPLAKGRRRAVRSN